LASSFFHLIASNKRLSLCEYKADFFFLLSFPRTKCYTATSLCILHFALDYLAGHASENNTHSARERGRVARESPFAADIAAGGRCLRMLCNASSLPRAPRLGSALPLPMDRGPCRRTNYVCVFKVCDSNGSFRSSIETIKNVIQLLSPMNTRNI